MLFSDDSILKAIRENRIQIKPEFREKHLRPIGLRIHLGEKILIPVGGQTVDFSRPRDIKYRSHSLRESSYTLLPGAFVLGGTVEQVKTDSDVVCILEGRSTMARLGLTIHNTASVLDGACGHWLTPVLEIVNHGNFSITLSHGVPIGMFCFSELDTPQSNKRIQSQYARQDGTTPPNLTDNALIDTFD